MIDDLPRWKNEKVKKYKDFCFRSGLVVTSDTHVEKYRDFSCGLILVGGLPRSKYFSKVSNFHKHF
jgi:hypothetical protein